MNSLKHLIVEYSFLEYLNCYINPLISGFKWGGWYSYSMMKWYYWAIAIAFGIGLTVKIIFEVLLFLH